MKRVVIGVVAVALLVIGGTMPASAEETESDVLQQILDDTASARLEGDDVVARTGDVTAVLPTDVDEPVMLSAPGGQVVTVSLPSDDAAAPSKRVGAAAVEHERGDGSSIVPAVRSNGVLQVMSVMDDAASPTAFTYEVAAGDGSSLVALPDGGVIVLDSDGQEAAMVAPPWALDAEGRSIPTRYEIDGERLTQVVDTAAAADVAYPVVADPGISVTYTQYRITDLSRSDNWTNRGVQIGLCKIERGAGGGQCTISASRDVGTTIQTSLGATVSDVAAGINFSASHKRTVSVSWTSPRASVGSSFKAWATGTKASYRVQKWIGNKVVGEYRPRWRLVETSGQLMAFSPNDGFAIGQ
ncbi:hypothetical protein [Microbacterium sp. VKM Ac-2923]|uniref:hypothetical protein n=1 Tax=Microbacterium sp. VKM Ac-2923 TaxID=2929476 RepID=UPI001FB34FBD|nr:hypothetical protein [Microbacterium sp. VKM Ac-2923]MCJ1706463.1 hypothetical protein [Microbacterium sp. VKM Ac-2923]